MGEGWNESQWSYTNLNYFNSLGNTLLGNDFSVNQDGFVGGAYIGYNFRTGPFISGIEASYLGADISTTFDSPLYPTDEYTSKINNFAMARVRIAYPLQRWFFAVTGGWAGGDSSLTLKDPIADIKASTSQWANGWTVGAAIDYKLWLHMSIGLAYDYVDLSFDNKSLSCDSCGSGIGAGSPNVDGTMKTQMLTARVGYYF